MVVLGGNVVVDDVVEVVEAIVVLVVVVVVGRPLGFSFFSANTGEVQPNNSDITTRTPRIM